VYQEFLPYFNFIISIKKELGNSVSGLNLLDRNTYQRVMEQERVAGADQDGQGWRGCRLVPLSRNLEFSEEDDSVQHATTSPLCTFAGSLAHHQFVTPPLPPP
jgi:hypothetical protein